jgi:hypothetical protein
MAFQTAAGYGNLPNGVFSPTIYSKKVQKQFRRTAVAEAITNSDYFGEIKNFGDSVKIIKEPEIVVSAYARGTQLTPQDIEDSDFYLVVDRANSFIFRIDDIEKQQSHVNWMDLASDRAAYDMAMVYDRDILGYMSGFEFNEQTKVWTARTTPVGSKAETSADGDELLPAHKVDASAFGGSAANSIVVGVSGTYEATPLQVLNRFNRLLDEQNVPKDGRYVVMDPVFIEKLMDENSKFVNNDYMANQNAGGQLTNGKLVQSKIRGFDIYQSNNLPIVGTGPGTVGASNTSNYGVILAGHMSSAATAQQLEKTEHYRDPYSFGDIVRGMHLYGRKILKPQGLLRAIYNVNA